MEFYKLDIRILFFLYLICYRLSVNACSSLEEVYTKYIHKLFPHIILKILWQRGTIGNSSDQ